jgi:hypothetical protein
MRNRRNAKPQGWWWHLRTRFQNTYRAVAEGLTVDPDEIISIDPGFPELSALPPAALAADVLIQPRGEGDRGKEAARDAEPGPRRRGDDLLPAFEPGARGLGAARAGTLMALRGPAWRSSSRAADFKAANAFLALA